VYHSIVDDPKFGAIYDDDRRLATWLRLLIVAEQAHPASAYIPIGTNRAAIAALVDAGLIDLGTGSRYRIHGLDAERRRRTDAARVGGLASGRSRSVEQPLNERSTKTNLDETSIDKTRQDETSIVREGLPNLDHGAIRALEQRTGRTWGQAGEKQLTEYDRLIEDHGLEKVLSAMDRLMTDGKPMTARQLVWGAMKLLEPMVDLREAAKVERQEEVDRNSHRGVESTQRYLRELRGIS
jgi:hypothetical protein